MDGVSSPRKPNKRMTMTAQMMMMQIDAFPRPFHSITISTFHISPMKGPSTFPTTKPSFTHHNPALSITPTPSNQPLFHQLKPPRHKILKHPQRIELLTHPLQEIHTSLPIPLNGILLLASIIEIEIRIIRPRLLIRGLRVLEQTCREIVDILIGCGIGPLDGEEDIGKITPRGVDAEGVSRIGVAGGGETLGRDDLGEGLVGEGDGEIWGGLEGIEGGIGDVEEAGHGCGIVLERRRHEELAGTRWVAPQQLDGEVGQVGDAHGVEGLGQAREVPEGGRVGLRLGVLEVGGDVPARGEGVSEAHDERGVGVVVLGGGEGDEVVVLLLAGGDVLADEAAPEFALGEELHVEAGDDAEVVGAALEGFEEVGVGLRVGIDEFARREDDLEVDDIVADETVARREEGYAASESEACDADGSDTAS